MSTDLRLIMAQVDDVPGELIGEFIGRAEALGAHNIQVVSSITKKNRPGYLIYLDIPAALEAALARLLGAELGCWGYHVLAAEHRHFDITRYTLPLTVHIDSDGSAHDFAFSFSFSLRFKMIADGTECLRIKAEHDDVSAIARALAEAGHSLPLAVLKAMLESQLMARSAAMPRELQLCQIDGAWAINSS